MNTLGLPHEYLSKESGRVSFNRVGAGVWREAKAREILEAWRWPEGPVCPHCQNAGEKSVSKLAARSASSHGVHLGVDFCGAFVASNLP